MAGIIAKDLAAYGVDSVRGFLPTADPLPRLPAPFEAWEATAAAIPRLLAANELRPTLERLPIPDVDALADERQLHRAMLVFSFLGSACVWGGSPPATRLPAAIALPWCRVAERVGRPPITSHASAVLTNWRRIDPGGPIEPDNLRALVLFSGTPDEEWFFTVTVAIEASGAPALPALIRAQKATEAGCAEAVGESLGKVAAVIGDVERQLQRMRERCAPRVFFDRIRPFLTGWPEPGVVYEGVGAEPRRLTGGSAAQSSLLQALDAGLGIQPDDAEARSFLLEMRGYMPPGHRRFLEALEAGPSLRRFVRERGGVLGDRYNACVQALDSFRETHMAIALDYVLRMAPAPREAQGTGGTNFVRFLTQVSQATRQALIPPLPP